MANKYASLKKIAIRQYKCVVMNQECSLIFDDAAEAVLPVQTTTSPGQPAFPPIPALPAMPNMPPMPPMPTNGISEIDTTGLLTLYFLAFYTIRAGSFYSNVKP